MSIRPIDMQVMVQRAQEVSRVATNDGQRADAQNSQFAQSFEKAVAQDTRQVVNPNKAEQANINKDGRGNSGGGQGKSKDRKNREDSKKTLPVAQSQNRGLLDIRI